MSGKEDIHKQIEAAIREGHEAADRVIEATQKLSECTDEVERAEVRKELATFNEIRREKNKEVSALIEKAKG